MKKEFFLEYQRFKYDYKQKFDVLC